MFLFYEKLVRYYGKGVLCMISSEDLVNWSEEKVILDKPIHLSYPNVFENDGRVYMLPETGANGTIELYECSNGKLDEWHLVSLLVDKKAKWADSTILQEGGIYYLFTSVKVDGINTQYLFTSNNIMGPFKEHPKSPIHTGNDYGRNGGSIIKYKEKLLRPSQACVGGYGEEVSILEILNISEKEYNEKPILLEVIKRLNPQNIHGGHQFNMAKFNGSYYVAYDYREKNYNVIELYRRIKRNIIKIWK